MKAERIAALFSFGCQRAREKKVNHLLKEIAEGKMEGEKAWEVLSFLESFFYYEILARMTGERKITPKIVKSYWIGGEILEREIENRDFEKEREIVLKEGKEFDLEEKGMILLKLKILEKKKGFLFHNLTTFLFLGKNFLEFPERNRIFDCRIEIGEVREIDKDKVLVEGDFLGIEKGEFIKKKEKRWIKKGFLSSPRVGKLVAFHFNLGRIFVNRKEKEIFERFDKKAIQILNSGSPKD